MKLLTIILVLLAILNSYPQADLDIPLTFITNEPQYNIWILNFGLDSTATNGIDPWLGEGTYPPDACGGWGFTSCIAFCFPPPTFNEDIGPRDYRFGILPFSGQIEHRLWIALGGGATQAELFWNFPEGVSVHIEDELGGILFELDLQGAGSFVITNSILNIFHRFKMIATYDNVTPIEFNSFNATVLQNKHSVQLNWTTATETNNSGFEINRKKLEARSQELEWENIGFVPGFGTTTEPKSYSFIDEDVTTGTYKYRLKQIDFDGSFEYSNEIEVVIDFTPTEFVLYQNYPNPFNPSTTIKYEIPGQARNDIVVVTLKVYDVLGNEVATLVNEEKQAGVYEVEFNSHSDEGQNLTSGVYFYQLSVRGPETSSGQKIIQTKKMILTK
jgi:hypothetical protein